MIKTDLYLTRKDGVNLYRTYSDEGYQIRQLETGAVYAEAIDVENAGYTYEETDTFPEDEITDSEALRILLGGDTDEPDENPEAP